MKGMLKKLSKLRNRFRDRNCLQPRFQPEGLNGYFSQCGQDKWIAETLLPGKRNGIFVDIGAHDGVTFSNTLFLEKNLGWTGLAVEPIPEVFDKLKLNRQCTVINGCVGSPPGKRKFRRVSGYAEMLSGLVDEYDPRHEERIQQETAAKGGSIHEIEVDCFDLNSLLMDHQITSVDYLNIDVEGSEFSIIKSIDFGRIRIKIIGVENNYKDKKAEIFLRKKGYKLHSRVGDDFYIAA
jgi:FkbM family methyltransferase